MPSVEQIAEAIALDVLRERVWLAEHQPVEKPRLPGRLVARTSDDMHEAIREVPCEDWLPQLCGVEVPRGRMICCPLPDHEDRTPSFRAYTTSWYCFGCSRGGDVYAFASELWGIPTRSSSFPDLRERLVRELLRGVA